MNSTTQAKKVIPWIIAMALFIETLDVTIIVTSIPKMALSLMVNPINLKLALTSYCLSLAVFIPVSGYVADKWGTQRTFLVALFVFILSSIGCGRATCLQELVIARILQGIGGAFMMPVGRLIMLHTFSKSEYIHAVNFMTTPALLGPLLGPVVGGFITTYYSWPWIFYVNIPIGLLAILATFRYIKNYKAEELRSFDKIGFLLFGISLAGLFFVFEVIQDTLIPTYVVAFVALGALLGFYLSYWHYKKVAYPILNLKLFSIRTFFVAALGNIWMRLGISSVAFLLPLFFQIGYGVSSINAGLLICVWTLGMIGMKFFNKAILRRFGFRKTLSFTSVLTGLSITSFSLISRMDIPLIIILILINGIVSSSQFLGMNVLYYVDLVSQDMSHATSISSTLQQLSMGLGIALSALVLQLFIAGQRWPVINNPDPFRWSFIAMGVLAAMSVLVFLRLKSGDGRDMTGLKES